jgi:hypothetical protein
VSLKDSWFLRRVALIASYVANERRFEPDMSGFLSGLLIGGGAVAVIVLIAYVNFARGVRW